MTQTTAPSESDRIESDRVPGAPHPRNAPRVIGQDQAIGQFLDAAAGGRIHHAWLLTGPRGVGKATLAWALARWLLVGGTERSLDVPQDAPELRRILALSEPRLHLLRRGLDDKGRVKAQIGVDDVRAMLAFFQMSSANGGRRVAIIDAADDMNTAAANALLKMLEEPPKDAVLLLIAHQPARLLPTIRSRCRELRLHPLAAEDLAQVLAGIDTDGPDTEDSAPLAALSDGSAGEALRLAGQDGLRVYQDIIDLFASLPRMDRPAAARLADQAGARSGADKSGTAGDAFDLILTLFERFLLRLARTGAIGAPLTEAAKGEAALLARLSPDPQAARKWATLGADALARARAGRAVNLDASALVMDMLITVAEGQI